MKALVHRDRFRLCLTRIACEQEQADLIRVDENLPGYVVWKIGHCSGFWSMTSQSYLETVPEYYSHFEFTIKRCQTVISVLNQRCLKIQKR